LIFFANVIKQKRELLAEIDTRNKNIIC